MSESSGRLRWRVVDLVTAAVLGVASGIIFLVWNQIGGWAFDAIDAAAPGVGGLVAGIWFLGAVLGGLVIRKPGAALFVEVLAAVVSMALGSQWGITTVYSGLFQGLGAELVFAAFAYRRFSLPVSMLSGVGAAVIEMIYEGFTGTFAMSLGYQVTYWVSTAVSGAVLAGLLGWLLVRGLARTGALDRFAAGREVRREV